ncbi:hypothetical protein [Oceanirhabdus sp. W0125-5]|uniref:hypothetical protein n=1 Tax=Oceanirhabdus sp. W0125-5 TaxID=2999116 RepID=UPI0022F333A9|nr:hypothetical protein [Oceanirhabdus sp. W0125-5]WBW98961.1 hypothetical protein OW730_09505 [Oceanirhabdus sp. W0125-5]
MKISDIIDNFNIINNAKVAIAPDGLIIYFPESEYIVELDKFGIKNDGTAPVETSKGINEALQYAKNKGYEKIIFPMGNYLISELDPIVIDLKNVIIDLNGSTFQINTNGLEKYSIIEIKDGAENIRLTNGVIRGDKDTHDYETIKTPHEWGHGLVFKGGINLEVDNISITNVTGYGVYTESGVGANLYHWLYTKDIVSGAISDDGKMIENNESCRTKEAYDISMCGNQFELGYTLGYQGYPYLKNKEYTSYFYDETMNFIQKKECLQFRKVDIPQGAKYVHCVYPQANIVSTLGYYAFVTNLKPPVNVNFHDCLIKENRSLGLGFCGGQHWTIENNIFEGNGGNAPSYAVDFEDGWELMQDVIFKNNKFVDNNNDLVVCAGDNLIFEANEFTKVVYIWPRTTNYHFKGNKFNGSSITYQLADNDCKINSNHYNNGTVRYNLTSPKLLDYTAFNETIIDSSVTGTEGLRLKECTINVENIKPFIKKIIFENSTIQVKEAEASNLKFVGCKISGEKWNLQNNHYFESCELNQLIFNTYINTDIINFNNCNFISSKILFNTWGSEAEVILENCEVLTELDISLISLSAGKTKLLRLFNNKINNKSNKPIIDIYDTTYSIPNGNIVLENNELIQDKYPYILDGRDINQGIINFTDKDNTISGPQMLNPKYINNQYFIIN